MDVYLETERLVLRRFTAGDVGLLVELDSDPEVMRFLTGKATPRDEVADTMAVNHRSRAVMRRSGLRFVEIHHEHFDDPLPGTEYGEVLYAIDRATWEAGRHE